MAPEEQLEWEARAGRPAAYAAIAAALFLAAGSLFYPVLAGAQQPNTIAKILVEWNDKPADFWVPTVLQVLGYLLLPVPFLYLYRVTKARREQLPDVARYIAMGGPIAVAVGFLVHQIALFGAAQDFAKNHGPLDLTRSPEGIGGAIGPVLNTEVAADNKFTDAAGNATVVAIQWAGGLAVAFAFVLLSLNAMRAGLLSRFMGYMGVIVGALTVIPIFPVPVVSIFWLGALGVLFLNRWPNGRGPAWEVVEEIPWPSAAQVRAAAAKPDTGRGDVDYDEDDDVEHVEPVHDGHPRSKKRKRKRRR